VVVIVPGGLGRGNKGARITLPANGDEIWPPSHPLGDWGHVASSPSGVWGKAKSMPSTQKIFFFDFGSQNGDLCAFWIFLTVQLFGLNAKSIDFRLFKLAVACMQRATQAC